MATKKTPPSKNGGWKKRIEDMGSVYRTKGPRHPLPDRHRPDRGPRGSAAGQKTTKV